MCVFPLCPADSIEANVESADMNVQNATQQLARAADYQVKLERTHTKKGSRRGTRRGEAFERTNVKRS